MAPCGRIMVSTLSKVSWLSEANMEKFACPQPGQAGTKKVIIHRRVRGVRREIFYFLL